MTRYSANRPNRTLVLHKEGCTHVPRAGLRPCGCGETGGGGNQTWFCEQHISIRAVSDVMRERFWAILLCGDCF